MNLGSLKQKSLQLIREYSNNGAVIGSGDNADYLLSMNGFINDAQMEIAHKRKIKDAYPLPTTPNISTDVYNKYLLPSNYMEFNSLTKDDDPYYGYVIGNGYIFIPKTVTSNFVLSYFKTPTEITNSTLDDYELEIDKDLHYIVAYKAAGLVVMDESPTISTILLNEYLRLLSTIKEKNEEITVVANVTGW